MKRTNKMLLLSSVMMLFAACSSSDHGELVGVQDRQEWFPSDPFGMVYIPQGSYNMGNADQDLPYTLTAPTKSVSIRSFYMDQTEITNNEYRQFVNWVRDSIVRFRLAEDGLAEGYEFIDYADMAEPTYYQEYIALNFPDSLQRHIDWEPFLEWRTDRYPSEEYTEIVESIFISPEERFQGGKMVDARQLNYVYYWLNRQKAGRKQNRVEYDYGDKDNDGLEYNYRDFIKENKEISDRSSFIEKEIINIYPDTLCWVHDLTYSFNEPQHDKYFWHPAYDDYPVVGVNWHQARAFANWRSKYRNDYLRREEGVTEQDFRLPTEAEWEYASRGGQNLVTYPWGGPYATNSSGCYLANFKPMRGNLTADGGFYPVKATAYSPNGFNLYCMGGNVAEWTSTAYEAASYYYVSDISPDFQYNASETDDVTLKRKVIRGGSWKDVAAFMQVSTRDFEYQDTGKSYVGFRTIQDFLGRDAKDF